MADQKYMEMALQLARGCKGQTSPNPAVGVVIVKNGRIIGLGSHLRPGEPHAEVHALNMAGHEAKGSTVYVTLEPCSHTGKTPPCADALIKNKVERVVVATLDPNPLVAGNGVRRLKEAGIVVETGILEEEARILNEDFNKYIVTGIPFITVKTATTLDGKTATVTGNSRWITGEKARHEVHQLRHQNDVILVGVNTVINDNPQLTTRLPEGGSNPVRVILDSHLRIPLQSNVVQDNQAPTWVITTNQADLYKQKQLEAHGVKVVRTESTGDDNRVNIKNMLKILGSHSFSSVLVEGGSEVNGSLLKEELIDKVICYVAPKLVGGKLAPSSFAGAGMEWMGDAAILENVQVDTIGEDIRITGYPYFKGG